MDELALDVRAEQRVDLAEELVLEARQEPAVHVGVRLPRNDVHLVAGFEHRRADGVA